LQAGDTARCELTVAERLSAMPRSPFHIALDLAFTNPLSEVATHFDRFFRQEASRFPIGAAYTEMSGFDINPDRWYFDVFAYKRYGGHDNYDWLSDWQSGSYEDMTLTGFEPLQAVYAGEAFEDDEFREAAYVAGLLVVAKYQDFIGRVVPLMRELRFPLLVTAHEYDFIYEVRPEVRIRNFGDHLILVDATRSGYNTNNPIKALLGSRISALWRKKSSAINIST